jgi:hypothetical protein
MAQDANDGSQLRGTPAVGSALSRQEKMSPGGAVAKVESSSAFARAARQWKLLGVQITAQQGLAATLTAHREEKGFQLVAWDCFA